MYRQFSGAGEVYKYFSGGVAGEVFIYTAGEVFIYTAGEVFIHFSVAGEAGKVFIYTDQNTLIKYVRPEIVRSYYERKGKNGQKSQRHLHVHLYLMTCAIGCCECLCKKN